MVSTGIKTAAPHLILTNATKQYSFPRGVCLLSLPSILIRNWNHCWRKVVSTFSMEYRTQDHLEGQRRQPWPLSISFGMTLGHPTKGASVAPRVCGRPPSVGTHSNLLHSPTHRCSLCIPRLSLCCRDTF